MNWYKQIKLAVSGEYWIDDSGNALYADGDVSDYNHEAYVAEQVMAKYDIDPNEVDYILMSEEELKERGVTEEDIKLILGEADLREYAMVQWGWKRLEGNNVETNTLTSQDLRNIANGLYDAFNEEAERDMFNIYVMSNNKWYENVPFHIIEQANPMKIRGFAIGQKAERWASQGQFGFAEPVKYDFDKPVPNVKQTEEKIVPEKKKSLTVIVDGANSYGEMTLYINGKRYNYRLPWSAKDIGNKITDFNRKGWGTQLKRIIDKIDPYII
jgi:hypothetical protein